jgi:hypothetical protein
MKAIKKGFKVYRPNKVAYHYQKSIEQKGCRNKNNIDFIKLAVRGTLDILARSRFDIIKVYIEHPINKGYFKQVYILKKNKKEYHLKTTCSLNYQI